jgi:hypothetical protein
MIRRRTALVVSLLLAAVVGAALLAPRTAATTRATLLPPEAALLPPDASFVLGLDLARFLASPFYLRYGAAAARPTPGAPATPFDPWADLAKRAGLKPERDLRQIIAAGDGSPNGTVIGVLLGKFEASPLEKALGQTAGIRRREHKEGTIWIVPASPGAGKTDTGFAVVDDGVAVAGPPDAVGLALERRARKSNGLLGNAALMALVERAQPNATFWLCGDSSTLAAATNAVPGAGGISLPALKSFVVSGDLIPDVSALIIGEAADEQSAKNVADMAQGILALVAMQGAQKPELRDLATGLTIAAEGPQVKIGARLKYDTLEKLMATPTARLPTPPTPRPTS